ncbi:Bifunctional inhibitor/lipid-transfer protein/seed storage 2S albumin superfamily protein [Striga hermonthica]|uniref:Bifunctional inhibitor/lipid-transfer protein/seed storage 2S albumin superfamily protein n=1 Tax=Striga hermonthica TaxID=68872 RepID=A0A9N7MKP2_STRHE|nr:Bifunctional inhibitor/lipid-transfer protein/seed storage 2S albumin superfamily protein [Striga hermonthica]
MNTKTWLAVYAILIVLIFGHVQVTKAATCDVSRLTPCAPAIASNSTPSTDCCARLKEQQPCLCQYLKNPLLQTYINSPGAKTVAAACKTTKPKC